MTDAADVIDRLVAQLRERRHSRGLTQAEVAERCGVTRTQITNIESGKYRPSLLLLASYGVAVGLRLAFKNA